jgi:hypothetical protein
MKDNHNPFLLPKTPMGYGTRKNYSENRLGTCSQKFASHVLGDTFRMLTSQCQTFHCLVFMLCDSNWVKFN